MLHLAFGLRERCEAASSSGRNSAKGHSSQRPQPADTAHVTVAMAASTGESEKSKGCTEASFDAIKLRTLTVVGRNTAHRTTADALLQNNLSNVCKRLINYFIVHNKPPQSSQRTFH